MSNFSKAYDELFLLNKGRGPDKRPRRKKGLVEYHPVHGKMWKPSREKEEGKVEHHPVLGRMYGPPEEELKSPLPKTREEHMEEYAKRKAARKRESKPKFNPYRY